MEISFEEFDRLVQAWKNGERPDLSDLIFDGYNVEAMIRFMLDIPPEFQYREDDYDDEDY